MANTNSPTVCVFPDLSASAPTASLSSVVQGDIINFTGVIKNIGTADAGPYSNNIFYIDSNGDDYSDFTTTASEVTGNTIIGASNSTNGSWSVPIAATPGANYRIGYYADTNNVVNEGSGDGPWANWSGWSAPFTVTVAPPVALNFWPEPDHINPGGTSNLKWTVQKATQCIGSAGSSGWAAVQLSSAGTTHIFPVTPNSSTNYTLRCTGLGAPAEVTVRVKVPNATLTISPCTSLIQANQPGCDSTVTWTTVDFINPTPLLERGTTTPTFYSDQPNGSRVELVTPDDRTFVLKDTGGTLRLERSSNAACEPGSIWVGSPLNRCASLPIITITPEPDLVRSGNTAKVNITVDSNLELKCTLTGGINEIFTHLPLPTARSYNKTTAPISSSRIIKITCTSNDFPVVTSTKETRVNVVPVVQEI
jgi:hypothetical protein